MICSIEIRHFRSIEKTTLSNCGGLNVLIGKNNAGKSNVLSTIDLMHHHLSKATIAGSWDTLRPADEFTDRRSDNPLQIAIEFHLPPYLNQSLCEKLQMESPQLERSIDQIKNYNRITFVLSGALKDSAAFLFIEHISVGTLITDSQDIVIDGINLLKVSLPVGYELFRLQQATAAKREDIQKLEELHGDESRFNFIFDNREKPPRNFLQQFFRQRLTQPLVQQLGQLASESSTADDFREHLSVIIGEYKEEVEALESLETQGEIETFAGVAKSPPQYVTWLMKEYGNVSMMHLKETRDPIGRYEAEALLNLKVKRGGPEQLSNVQRTVKSLLGVEVDAFQSDDTGRGSRGSAEMDIDRFLVDANGAGIREALRFILDLELKRPKILLIEEPEVHLHPGLEHAVYSYMRDKSQDVQMFVTTHSTNFVDSVSFQNIYLVLRNSDQRTICQALDAGDGALKIPAELGLRLSTVFMFDRLVFVEGPSDEAVFREIAKTLDLDLAKANVGFVQMGGVRNFAHFAAQGTLELLTRRNIKMWFVTDRDERDDADVDRMLDRLGNAARLKVLVDRFVNT